MDLYEVLPIFYGTHGREMKSTRINLITAWGGSATKGGYTCVQKPRYFQTTGGKATDPDEGRRRGHGRQRCWHCHDLPTRRRYPVALRP